MKKKWALLLAAVMAMQPLAALNVSAAEVTDVYADVYGIEVEFGAEPAAADLGDLELLKGESEEPVAVDWATGETGTKRTINVELETDTKYTLSFGTTEKTFQVKTLFAEDFSGADFAEAKNITDTEEFANAYGEFKISHGTYGAFIKDGRVWVTDGALSITALDTNLDYADATISADIQGYGKNYTAGPGGRQWREPSEDAVNVYMLSRVTSGTTNHDAVGIRLMNDSFQSGTTNTTGGFNNATSINGQSNYQNNEDFAFGKFENIPDPGVAERPAAMITNKDRVLNETAPSSERRVALRANGTQVTSIVGQATDVAIVSAETTPTDYISAGAFSISEDKTGVASVDNVIITTYTENVTPAISGTLSVEDISYDFDKIVLSFNESIAEVGPTSRNTIKVYQDTATEPMTLTSSEIDTEDSTKLVVVPTGYTADHDYTVVVPEGFGTPTLKTDVEWSQTFTLESQPIEVESAEFTVGGILITFDTDLTDIADQADLDSIALEIDSVAVATANRTITKDAKTLLIAPTDYTIGKQYKVTIPQGFGTSNVYVKSDYVFDEEFTKMPMVAVKYTGNLGFIQVEFDEELDGSIDTSAVEIYDETGAVVTGTAATITSDGKLKVTIPNMEIDKDYELFIPENFGTDFMGTTQKTLKKFQQKTIAFENFDGDGQSFGGICASGFSKVQDPTDPTNLIGVNATGAILSNEAISTMENFTLQADIQVFAKIDNGRADDFGKYDYKWYTFGGIEFNRVDDTNKVLMAIRENGLTWSEKSTANGDLGGTSIKASGDNPYLLHGEIGTVDGALHIFQKNEAYPATYKLKDKAANPITHSKRNYYPGTSYTFVKTGTTISSTSGQLLKDENTGSYITNYDCNTWQNMTWATKTATKHTAKVGTVQLYDNGPAYHGFDNVRFSTFTLLEETNVVATKTTSDVVFGEDGKSTQTTITGTITLKNYTDENKDVRAVVVAYGEDNEMLCAELLTITGVNAGETQSDLPFSLDNTTGTKEVRLFLWDDVSHRTKIDNYIIAQQTPTV